MHGSAGCIAFGLRQQARRKYEYRYSIVCGGFVLEQRQQQENTLTGSLDEKKNGMFVVTDAEGAAYEFTYDPSDTPKGLDDAAEGDSVTVTYTGTVSEVDSFDGTVVSVEKAAAAQN